MSSKDNISEFTRRFLYFNAGKAKVDQYETSSDQTQREYKKMVMEHFINWYCEPFYIRLFLVFKDLILGIVMFFAGLVVGVLSIFVIAIKMSLDGGLNDFYSFIKRAYFLMKKGNKELYRNAKADYLNSNDYYDNYIKADDED